MTLGTNGYINPSVSGGGELGKGWDAYGSFSYINFDGNRANSNQELFYGYGNLGYRWNEDHETRLHVDIQNIAFQLPFSLTKQQLDQWGQTRLILTLLLCKLQILLIQSFLIF